MNIIFTFLIIVLFPPFLFAQTATAPSGGGIESDPYLIDNINNLYWITQNSSHWDKYYIQTANIDASSCSTWNSGAGFTPIGNDSVKFTGNYNAQDFIISNLFINRPNTKYVALFGYTENATITNVGLENVNITGYLHVATVVGYQNSGSTLSNSYATGTVSADVYVGGLVGVCTAAIIRNCYSSANVSGSIYIGGLVAGVLTGASLENCYSIGSVSAYHDRGGLVSAVTGTVSNSFWDTETSGRPYSAGGTGKTTVEMKKTSTFINAGWDFMDETTNGLNDYWGINPANNSGYPFLEWQGYSNNSPTEVTTQAVSNITGTEATGNGNITRLGSSNTTQHGVCWSTKQNPTIADNKTEEGAVSVTGAFTSTITGLSSSTTYYVRAYAVSSAGTSYGEQVQFFSIYGDGTEINPYQIENFNTLEWLMNTPAVWDKYFIQTANIDASPCSTWNSGAGFIPIGNVNNRFTGNYNGQGFIISNLFIFRPGGLLASLFGYTDHATIINVGLENVNISGYDYVGAIIGYDNNTSTLSNSYATGTVTGSNSNVGGLVGCCSETTISNCYSKVNVSGITNLGGLVGMIIHRSPNLTPNKCYSKGLVSGNSNVGGLIGVAFISSYVNKCFWDTETSEQDTSNGGTGKTTTEMKTYDTYVNACWDFKGETINGTDDIWNIGNGRNEGYPYLDWQFPSDPAPVPVELTSFTVSTTTEDGVETVELNWKTATEVDNYGFEIERRNQVSNIENQDISQSWEEIGFVEGHGNSNSPNHYTFKDKNAPCGIVEYRLKQINVDGTFEYSNTLETKIETPKAFKLSQNYPNPFNPRTTISYEIPSNTVIASGTKQPSKIATSSNETWTTHNDNMNVTLIIYNILGQEVETLVNGKQAPGKYKVQFDASHLTSGIYIYRLVAKTKGTTAFVNTKKLALLK